MFALFKLVVGGAVALALLVPVGIVLAVVGLPLMLVAGLLAVPVALALAIVGLPLLLLAVAGVVVLALVGTAVGIAVGLLAAVVKVALFVVLPIALVVWLARRIMARHDAAPSYDWV